MPRKLDLTPRSLAFIVATRAVLAAGLGMLLSGRLSRRARRAVGGGLLAVGAVTTLPAIRAIAASAH